MRMKSKIAFVTLLLTTVFQILPAQTTARGYSETHQLEELKTFDAQGRTTFRKWCLTDSHFEMHAWAFDAKGKPKQEWEVLWRTDKVIVREIRYFQGRVETWEPVQESRFSADPAFAKAIQQFKREGLPSTREELLDYPAIRKLFEGELYCSERSELNARDLPLTTTYFYPNGEKEREETSVYDAEGHCTSIIQQSWDPEPQRLVSTLTYNAQGKITQLVEVIEGEESTPLTVVTYSYEDTLLKERTQFLNGLNDENWTKTTLTYDEQHRLIRDEITDSEVAGPVSYKTFSYDSRGRMAKEEWFRRDDKRLQKIWSVNWVYE